jgi:hypothetical protein
VKTPEAISKISAFTEIQTPNTANDGPTLFPPVDALVENLYGEVVSYITSKGFNTYFLKPKFSGQSAYIGSIVSQYLRYALREWAASKSGYKRMLSRKLEQASAFGFSSLGIDRTLHINQKLLATALPPSRMYAPDYWELVIKLEREYPNHAIAVRGLNTFEHSDLLQELEAYGGNLMVSRKIYILDLRKGLLIKKRPLEQDMKRWEQQTQLVWRAINAQSDDELARCLYLYKQVYIHKHSELNPNYTRLFLKFALSEGLLTGEVLIDKHAQQILGVQLYSREGNSLNTPFIGYDLSMPKEMRLYPFLNVRLIHKALEKRCILNMSSGAGAFKKQRGGQPAYEYLVIFDAHLPVHRRLGWLLLSRAVKKVAMPYLENNDV